MTKEEVDVHFLAFVYRKPPARPGGVPFFEDNLELFSLLLNNSLDPAFAERIFSMQQITDLLHGALARCTDEQEKKATIAFAIYGSYKLLCDWINDPRRISPELQTQRILRLARRVCGDAT